VSLKKKTNDVLSINIAATTQTFYSVILEDFNVMGTTKWPYSKGSLDPRVSNGMMIGLDALVNMQGKSSINGKKCMLLEYLRDEVELNPKIEMQVFGFSLGGALAFVLGLYLYENQAFWNPTGSAKIKVFSFGSMTCGNVDFKIYYEERLYENTVRVWSTLDWTPLMFNQETLPNIPSIYEPHIQSNILIEGMAMFLSFLAGCNGYCHVREDAEPLVGVYYPVLDVKEEKKGLQCIVTDFQRFMEEGTYQHTREYFNILGVGDLWRYDPFGHNTFINTKDSDRILQLVSSKFTLRNFSLFANPKDVKPKNKKKKREKQITRN